MQYNIHPIIVHFPVALLFLYSFIKLLPLEKFFKNIAWKDVTKVLLFFGVLSIFVARSTGEVASELANPNHDILEMHEVFSGLTLFFYVILLIADFSLFLSNAKYIPFKIQRIFTFIDKVLSNTFPQKLLIVLGLISIAVTGLLGGVMVYGLTADPLAPFVLRILGISI